MVRKIIINLSNRWLYTFIALGVVILLGVVVYAAVDTTQGWHSWNQIADIPAGFADGTDDEGSGGVGACSDCDSSFVNEGDDDYNVDNEPTATGRGEPTKNEIVSWGADGYEAAVTSVDGLTGGTISGTVCASCSLLKVTTVSGTAVEGVSTYSPGVHGTGSPFGVMGTATGSTGVGVAGTGNWAGVSGTGQTYDFFAKGPGTDYGTSSSIRWKNNIIEIDNALDKILNIRGVYFDWDDEHGGQHDMGFIAEEVGEYIPEIVEYEEDSIYATGLDYGAITPVLVEAIKEQQQQIEGLKQRIEELE